MLTCPAPTKFGLPFIRRSHTLQAANKESADSAEESVRKIYQPGSRKRIIFGMMQKDVEVPLDSQGNPQTFEEYEESTKETRTRLQAKAIEELVVLDQDERNRRMLLGSIGLGLALLVDTGLVASKAGFYVRLLSYFPLAFGLSFFAAGKMGMCQIAAGGMWDVDGTGFKEIEDKEFAERIKNKYRNFSVILPVVAVSVTLAFAAIPLS